jgi:hypothetical protein
MRYYIYQIIKMLICINFLFWSEYMTPPPHLKEAFDIINEGRISIYKPAFKMG